LTVLAAALRAPRLANPKGQSLAAIAAGRKSANNISARGGCDYDRPCPIFGVLRVHPVSGIVFLSYSQMDKEKARLIADCLTFERIDVVWDVKIPPGSPDYQRVIAEMLDRASCVIVLWSPNSVKSDWVLIEATEAKERGIILPAMIESAKLPLGFKLVQTENFTQWQGDRLSEPWQRLILQVRAMLTAPHPEAPSKEMFSALVSAPPARPKAFGRMLTVLAICILGLFWFWGKDSLAIYFAVVIGVALLLLFLFKTAENDITPRMRALATQWLLPRNGGVHVNTSEALNQLFEAVFGEYHFSAFCFVRSTVASTLLLALLLILARTFLGATVQFTLGTWVSLIFFAGCVNVLGDYFSLFCTRIMLRLYKNGLNIVTVLLLDLVITLAIFTGTIALGIFLIDSIAVFNGDHSVLQGGTLSHAILHDVARVALQPYLAIYHPLSPELLPTGQQRLIYASAMTTFMTSIWLWAALMFTPIIRVLIWTGGTSLTTIGLIFDVHTTPFAALGYLSAAIVVLTGSSAWGATAVVSAIIK
jgi:hypothetical protein